MPAIERGLLVIIVDKPEDVVTKQNWSLWPGRVWPARRYAAAPRSVLIGALVVGCIGAVVLGDRGIGYPITAVAIIFAALRASKGAPTRWQLVGAVGVVALSSIAAFRAAEWLVTLAVVMAVLVAGVVLSRSWTWTGVALGALIPLLVPARVLRWCTRGSRRIDMRGLAPGRVFRVAATTAVLFLVFAGLFAGADPQFADVLSSATPTVRLDSGFTRILLFALVAAGTLAVSYVVANPPRFDALARPSAGSLRLWEWTVPLGSLVVLFTMFVFVQLRTLFGGQAHVRTTDGLTNAEYARQGFWQLLAVTVLTLLVLAVTIRKASRVSGSDRLALRLLLGVLCALSLVIVGSALHRMSLYEQQYGYTTLRVFVTAVELWLGSVFVLLMATGVSMSGRWLPRAVVGSAVLTVLALAVINPDAYIARQNVDRFEQTGKIDTAYLSRLSADATEELDRLDEPYRSCAIGNAVGAQRSWNEWNFADSQARRIQIEQPNRACADHAVR
ncbi:DUF4173 domain-containing protein [Rhodococcus sp. H36-A4]|uniref:DUF4153 domain-containing protein n=1 Tax=Rhodococcus sp. H36-A4 TaxID=3004353 RepID=UPI0022B069F2|nr:DUF4173 domain-containing protein [Rhodococcus sp. H36-A4]MCZ4078197.1 DUF4173 domain-containing protein [Rhodococcus sp. H36-A4]